MRWFVNLYGWIYWTKVATFGHLHRWDIKNFPVFVNNMKVLKDINSAFELIPWVGVLSNDSIMGFIQLEWVKPINWDLVYSVCHKPGPSKSSCGVLRDLIQGPAPWHTIIHSFLWSREPNVIYLLDPRPLSVSLIVRYRRHAPVKSYLVLNRSRVIQRAAVWLTKICFLSNITIFRETFE